MRALLGDCRRHKKAQEWICSGSGFLVKLNYIVSIHIPLGISWSSLVWYNGNFIIVSFVPRVIVFRNYSWPAHRRICSMALEWKSGSEAKHKANKIWHFHPVPQDVPGNQIERVASRDSFCCSGDKFGLLAESNTNPWSFFWRMQTSNAFMPQVLLAMATGWFLHHVEVVVCCSYIGIQWFPHVSTQWCHDCLCLRYPPWTVSSSWMMRPAACCNLLFEILHR